MQSPKRLCVDDGPPENDIDTEFMAAHFRIDETWFWIPLHVHEMAGLSRDKHLTETDLKRFQEKSTYQINVQDNSITNVKNEITLKQLSSHGYIRVHVLNNRIFMHKLICLLFRGLKPTGSHTVDHIDRVETNNSPNNLRYATYREQRINQTQPTNYNKQRPVDGFDKADYVELKFLIRNDEIYEFKPNQRRRTVHLCKEGKNVVINGKWFANIAIVKGYAMLKLGGKSFPLNRLMWINAFECTETPKCVYHIDANPANWALSNLRACTASENARSVLREQRRRKNIFITLLDTDNNNEIHFHSMIECYEFLGSTREKLRYIFKEGARIGKYLVLRIEKRNTIVPVRRKVRLETMVFESIKSCADWIVAETNLELPSILDGMKSALKRKERFYDLEIEYVN